MTSEFRSVDRAGISKEYQRTRSKLQKILIALAAIADERGERIRSDEIDKDQAGELLGEIIRDRVSALDKPFQLAVVGHFSRGKSTLINALLERKLLKAAVIPNTAACTVVKHGEPERFKVTYRTGTDRANIEQESLDLANDIARYTSDSSVGENEAEAMERYTAVMEKRSTSLSELIDQVDIWCQSDFLSSLGIEIVDTPGIDAVFKEHQRVTIRRIPSVDATIFLFQPDPGLGERELLFIQFIKEFVNSMFFVMTKVDSVEPEVANGMLDFARNALAARTNTLIEHIYPVSARKALNGGDPGFDVFRKALQSFLVENTGKARLRRSIVLAMLTCDDLLAAVETDLNAVSKTLAELDAELLSIKQEAKNIRKERDELLHRIDQRIEHIIADSVDKIETLPGLLLATVEQRINSLSFEQLKFADEYLQPVMKDTVMEWLGKNQKVVESQIKVLNNGIRNDIESMFGSGKSKRERDRLLRTVDIHITSPISISDVLDESVSDRLVRLLGSVGVTGAIVDALAAITESVVDSGRRLINAVGGFFGRLLGTNKTNTPILADRTTKARDRVRLYLRQPVRGTGRNLYEVIVEGSERNVGVRATIEQNFTQWRDQLKKEVRDIVNSRVNAKLSQLSMQIKEKSAQETVTNSRAREQRLQHQKDLLEDLRRKLSAVDTHIQGLGR